MSKFSFFVLFSVALICETSDAEARVFGSEFRAVPHCSRSTKTGIFVTNQGGHSGQISNTGSTDQWVWIDLSLSDQFGHAFRESEPVMVRAHSSQGFARQSYFTTIYSSAGRVIVTATTTLRGHRTKTGGCKFQVL